MSTLVRMVRKSGIDRRLKDTPEVYPLIALCASVSIFAAYNLVRGARSTDVVFRHHSNPEPWNTQHPFEAGRLQRIIDGKEA